MEKKRQRTLYIKNFIFGVEDSLVSTTGLLSGIAVAHVDKSTIFLTGIVLIFVEAFSMGVGSFLSEKTAEEYAKTKGSQASISGGIIMFFSYFAAGFVPLFPYIAFDVNYAFIISLVLAFSALFVLGYVGANLVGADARRSALRMLLVGGIATIAGIVVGKLVNNSMV